MRFIRMIKRPTYFSTGASIAGVLCFLQFLLLVVALVSVAAEDGFLTVDGATQTNLVEVVSSGEIFSFNEEVVMSRFVMGGEMEITTNARGRDNLTRNKTADPTIVNDVDHFKCSLHGDIGCNVLTYVSAEGKDGKHDTTIVCWPCYQSMLKALCATMIE